MSIKQRQQVPLIELLQSILMLTSLLNDLVIMIIYEVKVEIHDRSQLIFITVVLILLTRMRFRLTQCLLVPTIISLIASKYRSHESYILLGLALIFQVGYVALVMAMPQYYPPKPSGEEKIGYRKLTLAKAHTSIYYPATQDSQSKARSFRAAQEEDYVASIYNDFQHVMKYRPPLWVVRLFLNFVNDIRVEGVILNAQHKQGRQPVIIFSNGLGGLVDHYAVFLKEWASLGFVVVAVQQHEIAIILDDEEIKSVMSGVAHIDNDLGKQLMVKVQKIRNQQLDVRVEHLRQVLNWVCEQPFCDKGRVFVAGHSFGGASAHRLAQLDDRITGGVIEFDPWFLPLNRSDLAIKLKVPLLCVNSETFRLRKENETPERNNIVFSAQSQKLVIKILGSQHLCCTDLVFYMPFELKLFTKLNNLNKITDITLAHLAASRAFLLDTKRSLSVFEEQMKKNHKTPIYEIEYQ